jgi:hypothetical protein
MKWGDNILRIYVRTYIHMASTWEALQEEVFVLGICTQKAICARTGICSRIEKSISKNDIHNNCRKEKKGETEFFKIR